MPKRGAIFFLNWLVQPVHADSGHDFTSTWTTCRLVRFTYPGDLIWKYGSNRVSKSQIAICPATSIENKKCHVSKNSTCHLHGSNHVNNLASCHVIMWRQMPCHYACQHTVPLSSDGTPRVTGNSSTSLRALMFTSVQISPCQRTLLSRLSGACRQHTFALLITRRRCFFQCRGVAGLSMIQWFYNQTYTC